MKLLVVEDNADYVRILEKVLSGRGHDVAWAHDLATARIAADDGVEVALVDIRLPDGEGSDFIVELKARFPDSEVVLMTGHAGVRVAVTALQRGAFAFLTKPMHLDELLHNLDRAHESVQLKQRSRALQVALEASESRLRGVISSLGALIVSVDANAHIQFANPAAQSILGWAPEELSGQDLVETIVAPQERVEFRSFLERLQKERNGRREVDCLHRDGRFRRLAWRWTVPARGTREQGAYGVATDVTAIREMERRSMVSQKLEVVEALVAGLAHEIKNPLNAAGLQLSLLSRLLQSLPQDSQVPLRKPVEIVQAELQRLSRLLQDVLFVMRPHTYSLSAVDLVGVVKGVIDLQGEAARAAGVTLEMSADGPVVVATNAGAVHQIVMNLLKNAMEAARSCVRARIYFERERAIIAVEDDGPGILPEQQSRLFQPFYTTKPTGTGLGLWVVLTLANALSGEVTVMPREEGGVQARLLLPQAAED